MFRGLRGFRFMSEAAVAVPSSSSFIPRLIAFDLDDTLWHPEMEMCAGPPFTRDAKGTVKDCSGTPMRLMGNSRSILQVLKTDRRFAGVQVAFVSRTECPDWAKELIQLMPVYETFTMADCSHMELHQIYPNDKKVHFTRIHKLSGVAFADMLFFDNEIRNIRSVSTLGVTSIYTPDGMTEASWEAGLLQFSQRKAVASTAD